MQLCNTSAIKMHFVNFSNSTGHKIYSWFAVAGGVSKWDLKPHDDSCLGDLMTIDALWLPLPAFKASKLLPVCLDSCTKTLLASEVYPPWLRRLCVTRLALLSRLLESQGRGARTGSNNGPEERGWVSSRLRSLKNFSSSLIGGNNKACSL